ncbi:Golgi to ER traffic protein 4 homolog [Clavelina lepadiformis]
MSNALARIEEKLAKSKSSCNFYEAHQLYTTLYHRYNAKKRFQDARDLVRSGAIFLFENSEFGSASQLCMLFVESLEKFSSDVANDDIIETLGEMHVLLPNDMVEKESFEKRAVAWSATCADAPKTGNKQLRQKFAVNYWKSKMFAEARRHFLYSGDGANFGKMLQDYSLHHGLAGEVDLFPVQAILQLLCTKCDEAANNVFISYTTSHPLIGSGPPYKYPLINFIYFLLVSVKDCQLPMFTVLCELYQPSLQRDILYFNYLEKIAQHYFGLVTTNEKPQGFFENLMKSFFDDESDKGNDKSASLTVEDLD